jgi:hypothetical protein
VIRRFLTVLGALVAAWLVACLVLFVWPPAETGAPKAGADAVVVLSGMQNRLPPALALIRNHVVPVLVLSSVSRTPKWKAGRRLCRVGTYDGARVLCFEARPYSTRGEARAVRDLARQHGWHSIVIVSSTFHLTRVNILFRRCYHGRISLVGAPATWWELPLDWGNETAKLLVQLTVERGC